MCTEPGEYVAWALQKDSVRVLEIRVGHRAPKPECSWVLVIKGYASNGKLPTSWREGVFCP